jgi:Domain of unknown function (DUF4214)
MDGETIIGYLENRGEAEEAAIPQPDGVLHVNQALRRLRLDHLARLTERALDILEMFGLEIAIGFLYYEVLGRPPDPSGFSHYMAATGAQKLTFSDIVAGMVDSEEFVNRYPYMKQPD